jgi:hypothetical protein
MKNGPEIPRAAVVVIVIVVVALIGFIGSKVLLPPQRVHMSPEAIKGMKEHKIGPGAAAPGMPGPGGGQHSQ